MASWAPGQCPPAPGPVWQRPPCSLRGSKCKENWNLGRSGSAASKTGSQRIQRSKCGNDFENQNILKSTNDSNDPNDHMIHYSKLNFGIVDHRIRPSEELVAYGAHLFAARATEHS